MLQTKRTKLIFTDFKTYLALFETLRNFFNCFILLHNLSNKRGIKVLKSNFKDEKSFKISKNSNERFFQIFKHCADCQAPLQKWTLVHIPMCGMKMEKNSHSVLLRV